MLNKLKFLVDGMSTDASRKNLMFINCEVNCNILHMTAANGFIIKTIETCTELDDCKFYIDLDSVKKIIKIAGKSAIQLLETKAVIENIDINYQCKFEDFHYPDLKSLMNRNFSEPMPYMAINNHYLSLALKNAPLDSSDVIAFRFSGVTGPIKIDFGRMHEEYTAYIMPVRIDW